MRGVGRGAVAGMVGILTWHCTAYVSENKVTNQCFFGSYEPCPGLTHAPGGGGGYSQKNG